MSRRCIFGIVLEMASASLRSGLCAYVAVALIALLTACSGSVTATPVASIGTPSPIPSPTASPPPLGALSVNPIAIQLLGIGSSNAASGLLQETGYSGTFLESDTCSGIATVLPSSGTGPSLAFNVTGVAAGNCTATFSDAKSQHVSTAISVTIVSGSVQ